MTTFEHRLYSGIGFLPFGGVGNIAAKHLLRDPSYSNEAKDLGLLAVETILGGVGKMISAVDQNVPTLVDIVLQSPDIGLDASEFFTVPKEIALDELTFNIADQLAVNGSDLGSVSEGAFLL